MKKTTKKTSKKQITSAAGSLEKVRKKIAALGLTEDDVNDAVAGARGKRLRPESHEVPGTNRRRRCE